MNKIIFTTAITTMLFAGCFNLNAHVKKIPSEICVEGGPCLEIQYDEKNRPIKIVQTDLGCGPDTNIYIHTTEIIYDENKNPSKIIITYDERTEINNEAIEFQYKNNLILVVEKVLPTPKIFTIDVTEQFIGNKNIWQHVNSPDWFLNYLFNMYIYIDISGTDIYNKILDTDGYFIRGDGMFFDYILAK